MLQEQEYFHKAVRNKQVIIWTFCKCTNSEAFSKGNLNFSEGNFFANLPPRYWKLSLVLPLCSRAAAQVQESKLKPQDLQLLLVTAFFLPYNPTAQSGKHRTCEVLQQRLGYSRWNLFLQSFFTPLHHFAQCPRRADLYSQMLHFNIRCFQQCWLSAFHTTTPSTLSSLYKIKIPVRARQMEVLPTNKLYAKDTWIFHTFLQPESSACLAQ